MELFAIIRRAIADPGKHVTRLGVGHPGYEAEGVEPLYVWEARAVCAALQAELVSTAGSLNDYDDEIDRRLWGQSDSGHASPPGAGVLTALADHLDPEWTAADEADYAERSY